MGKHIIHKVYLELTTGSVADAHELKDNIGSFLSTEVFPLLEKQIDAIDDGMSSYAIRLDQVNVEITEKGIQLNDDLKYTIVKTVEEETQKVIKTIDNEQKSTEEIIQKKKLSHKSEHQLETFIHFLKTGTNPWWNTESITKLLTPKNFEKLLKTPDFTTKVLRTLRDEKVRKRLMNQLTRASVKALCVTISEESDVLDIKEETLQKISKRPVVQQQQIWKEILAAIAHQESIDIITLIAIVKEEATLQKITQKQIEKEQKREAQKQASSKEEQLDQAAINREVIEAIINPKSAENDKQVQLSESDKMIEDQYVQNAGLVLIHPFLQHFFDHCNLLDEKKQLKDPERCVHLLHYIATGKTKQAESDMLFEKFLCEVPINQSINRNITITKKQKEQVENLLNAVNQNWGALQKGSHALLQNEFLQRMGKIEKNSSGTTIEMERKAQDILLRKLSWGMGLIRLPWKKEFIYVNW